MSSTGWSDYFPLCSFWRQRGLLGALADTCEFHPQEINKTLSK